MDEREGGDVILPLPDLLQPARAVRSTLLVSSFATLRERGHGDRYLALLPEVHHRTVIDAVAGMWIPIEVCIAHYTACDGLGLAPDTIVEIGRAVSNRMRGTLLGTLVRMSREAGVTPWTVLPQFGRFWSRAFDGGAVTVHRLGPKEARVEVWRSPQCDCRYFRNSLRGHTMGVLDLFCTKSYMQERTGPRALGSASYRVQWA